MSYFFTQNPFQRKRGNKLMDHMTFDEFKEVLAEDLKESLYPRGYEDVEIGFRYASIYQDENTYCVPTWEIKTLSIK